MESDKSGSGSSGSSRVSNHTNGIQQTLQAPEVSPAVFGRDMAILIGLIAGCMCAVFVMGLLYSWMHSRKHQRKAKLRRHLTMMEASDAALHTPIGALWSTNIPMQGSHDTLARSGSLPQLMSSRPRQPSLEGIYARSGITLRSEVLDSLFYTGTLRKKTRMNGDLAQAIAAFGLPSSGLPSIRKSSRSHDSDYDDRMQLPANMEVIYQERTAV